MHLVTQPSQVQVSQSQHFISTEAQQRMVVPQPRPSGSAMKVISSSQQHALASQSSGNGGQAIVRPSMSNIAQPPSQQPNDHSGSVFLFFVEPLFFLFYSRFVLILNISCRRSNFSSLQYGNAACWTFDPGAAATANTTLLDDSG